MSAASFRAPLLATGGNTTGFEVPAEAVAELGGGKKPKVSATLNGDYTYRSSVAVMGGRYMLGVSAAHRQASGISAGDEVLVALLLDTAPREVEVPDDLQGALEANPDAKAAFDKLAYSHQLRHVLSVVEAKTPGTRERRIARMLEMLLLGKK